MLPYRWGAETPLSNHEIRLDDATRPRQDPAVTVAFTLDDAEGIPGDGPAAILAWTTTPWTLPSNLALAVGPDLDYAVMRDADGTRYLIGEAVLGKYDKQMEHAEQVGEKVLSLFEEGGFDVATLFFSRFKSVISQIPTAQQVIPASIPEDGASVDLGGAVYEYEPDEEEILTELLPLNITTQIFKALLENGASEQGARMSAMDSATRNAGDMIGKLTLNYNRTRQAQITKELIEIISGAEAL